MKIRWTISGSYLSFMLILMVVTLTCLGTLSFFVEYQQFRIESRQIQAHFTRTRKSALIHLSDRLETTLARDIDLAERMHKRQLKEQVLETCSLLLAIHAENPIGLPLEARETLMHNILQNARAKTNGRFFFALDTGGTLLFNSIRPELDGTPLHDLPRHEELPIARQIVGTALAQGEGYLTYRYPKPNDPQGPLYLKTSYIRFLKPLGWIVGSGYYHDTFAQTLQSKIIHELPSMEDNDGDHIFIMTDSGKVLSGPPDLATKLPILPSYGGFIHHENATGDENPLLAYIRPFKPWNWYIGATASTHDIARSIHQNQQERKKRIHRHFLHIIVILCTTLFITIAFSCLFSRRLARSFAYFNTFFKKASNDFTTIDPDKMLFSELKSLADAGNRMTIKRKRSEAALVESEEKYRTLVDNALHGVMIIQHQRIVFANEACTTITGHTSEEIMAADTASLWEWTYPDDINPAWSCFNDVLRSPNAPPKTWEHRISDCHGELVWIEITINHLSYLGHPAALCSFSDITLRKANEIELADYRNRLEEKVKEKTEALTEAKNIAERALGVKSRFLSNISHEIKTPMNAIMGVSELLKAEGLSKKQTGYINIMNRSSRALMTLLEDILDFSRAKSGKMVAEIIPFNPMELLEEVVDTVSHLIDEKSLSLIIDIDPTLPLTLMGDPLRIRQVLVNLTTNAIKFTPSGGVTLSCRVINREPEHITFVAEVRDTGIGIDFSKLPGGDVQILFEPFRQADSSTTREYGGSGLGLAICENIVELLDGTLSVKSQPGEGSCFSFQLTTPWKASSLPPRPPLLSTALVIGPPCPEEAIIHRTLLWSGFTVERILPPAIVTAQDHPYDLIFWLLAPSSLEPSTPLPITHWPHGIKGTLALCPAALGDTALGILGGESQATLLTTPLKPSHLIRRISQSLGDPAQRPHPMEKKNTPPKGDAYPSIITALKHLQTKLTENKFDTEQEIEMIKAQLPPQASPLIEELIHNIDHFNYYTALATLDKITETYAGAGAL